MRRLEGSRRRIPGIPGSPGPSEKLVLDKRKNKRSREKGRDGQKEGMKGEEGKYAVPNQ